MPSLPNITTTPATLTDIPTLISIYITSMEVDPLQRFLNSHHHEEAVKMQTEALTSSLGKRFTNPTNRCYIHKAVDRERNQIVGWSLVRWEDATKIAVPEEKEYESFKEWYVRDVIGKWRDLAMNEVEEGRHVVLGGLYIAPAHQGLGIGKKMVEDLYEQYDLDSETVILQTRACSEGFYRKLGWETVACTEVDLSKLAGEGRGFGWHRSPQMVKRPRRL